jgi:CRP/FNR family transcriptional regulator
MTEWPLRTVPTDEIPFLACLTADQKRALEGRIRVRNYRARDQVFVPGDLVPGLLLQAQGLVFLYSTEGADDRVSPLILIWPGHVYPYGMVSRDEWPCHAQALADSTVVVISHDAVESVLLRNLESVKQLLITVSDQMGHAGRWLATTSGVSLRPRLARILVGLAEGMGQQSDKGLLLDMPLTNGRLGALAGVSRDEAGRASRDLQRQGLVNKRAKYRLVIPDLDRLREVAMLPDDSGEMISAPAVRL